MDTEQSPFGEKQKYVDMKRLQDSGIEAVNLILQYRMHPDISEDSIQFVYGGLLQNHPSTLTSGPYLGACRLWISKFLNVPLAQCRMSIMANVVGGVCRMVKGSSSFVNLHNLVVIADIIKSLLAFGIPPKAYLLFYGMERMCAS